MLLSTLVVARVRHPIGMVEPEASLQQLVFRGASGVLTWLVLLSAAILLLFRATHS